MRDEEKERLGGLNPALEVVSGEVGKGQVGLHGLDPLVPLRGELEEVDPPFLGRAEDFTANCRIRLTAPVASQVTDDQD